jgi:hypothetical protein
VVDVSPAVFVGPSGFDLLVVIDCPAVVSLGLSIVVVGSPFDVVGTAVVVEDTWVANDPAVAVLGSAVVAPDP